MGAHIVICEKKRDIDIFLKKGFVGVKAKIPSGDSPKEKIKALNANYSLICDLKSVKTGDLIFLYSEGRIYGVFRAASPFLEHPNTPIEYKSEFLRYHPPFPCWASHRLFPKSDYFWQMSITSVPKKTFKKGIKVPESFSLTNEDGMSWNLPDRFDSKSVQKQINPIITFEAKELLKILEEGNEYLNIKSKNMKGFKRISLSLSVDKHGFLENKKIIEAWLFDNMTLERHNKKEYKNILETLGTINNPDVQIPDFYLDFMEVFPYLAKVEKKHVFQIIDIHTGYLDKKFLFDKLPKLIRYAFSLANTVTKGNLKGVQISIIAKGFHPYLFDYIKLRNIVEPGNPIHLIKYDVFKEKGKNKLKLLRLTQSF